MKIYLLDTVSCYAGEAEVDPMAALPRCALTPPPVTTGLQVAQFAGSEWVVLDAYPTPPEPPAPDYRVQRAAEYPPMTDYIDGVVKGDTAQVKAYIDACLAVKAKYPKPA